MAQADAAGNIDVGGAAELTPLGRYLVLIAAFLGWMCAGFQLGNFLLASGPITRTFRAEAVAAEVSAIPEETLRTGASANVRDVSLDELRKAVVTARLKTEAGTWFGYYTCAFLLGAALGGYLFGKLGDRVGRVKAMAYSILCYSIFGGLCAFGQSLEQLLVIRFIACLGVGGMWPTGVALASEAWSNASRPLLSGLIGTSANVGIALIGKIGQWWVITESNWHWLMAFTATPIVLGLFSLFAVPESLRWLAQRNRKSQPETNAAAESPSVFRPPYLRLTVIGILLGTIPLLGGWGTANWLVPWADYVGLQSQLENLKADTQFYGSTGAAIGSLCGGWIASLVGRRLTYFLISLGSLVLSGWIFWWLTPDHAVFLWAVFLMRLVSTTYFGWLPLYLPELFPTEIRATGSGVTFNFGRVFSMFGVLGTTALLNVFGGSYAQTGRVTHLIFAMGMLVILFAPDTSQRKMDD